MIGFLIVYARKAWVLLLTLFFMVLLWCLAVFLAFGAAWQSIRSRGESK